MIKTKPNCRSENYACGNKCQPKSYRCPSEKSPATDGVLNKFSKILEKPLLSARENKLLSRALKILDPKTKKLRREALSSSDKKKKLLNEEEKAWTLMRLLREKERLLKKGLDTSNLDQVIKDYRSKASIDFVRNNLIKKKSLTKEASATMSSTAELIQRSKKESVGLRQNLKKVRDAAVAVAVVKSKTTDRDLDHVELLIRTDGEYFQTKIDEIRSSNPKLSELEVRALLAWTGNDYEPINRVLYSSDEEFEEMEASDRAYGVSASILATKAISKVEEKYKYSRENLVRFGESRARTVKSFRDDELLSRALIIKDKDLNNFLKPYRESLDNGSNHVEKTFVATTALKQIFDDTATVELLIKAKQQSSATKGILADEFKMGTIYEGEVLFPPFTKFKVTNISNPNTEYSDHKTKLESLLLKKEQEEILLADTAISKEIKDLLEEAKFLNFFAIQELISELYSLTSSSKKISGKTLKTIKEAIGNFANILSEEDNFQKAKAKNKGKNPNKIIRVFLEEV